MEPFLVQGLLREFDGGDCHCMFAYKNMIIGRASDYEEKANQEG
jgi:hypothetical protein